MPILQVLGDTTDNYHAVATVTTTDTTANAAADNTAMPAYTTTGSGCTVAMPQTTKGMVCTVAMPLTLAGPHVLGCTTDTATTPLPPAAPSCLHC